MLGCHNGQAAAQEVRRVTPDQRETLLGAWHGSRRSQHGLLGAQLKALCLVLVISDNAQVLIMCLRLYVAKVIST
jgi:hypothetical protein